IKGGTLILETQQSSDITYRVYDYDRLSEGRPRQLHVQQSIDVIEAPFVQREDEKPVLVEETDSGKKYHLITCSYYTADKVDMAGEWEEDFGDRFANVSILEGQGTVDGAVVKKGCHFIVPAGYGIVRFQGNLSFITSQAM
ncbi:MAG: mannose-6-phosphate isomerase, partial [Enterocloster aldenensis]